jgi:putative heme transporter
MPRRWRWQQDWPGITHLPARLYRRVGSAVHDQTVSTPQDANPPRGDEFLPPSQPRPLSAALVKGADFSWRILAIGALAFVVLMLVGKIVPVLVALFIALFLAAVLHPATTWLAKYVWRWAAVTIVLVLFVALLAGAIAFISASVAGEWHTLWLAIQKGILQVEDWLRTGPFHLSKTDLTHLIQTVEKWLTSRSSSLLKALATSAGSMFDVLTAILTGVFALIFFLLQPRQMFDWLLSWTPKRARLRTDEAATIAWDSFSNYTRGIIVVALSDAIVVGIGLAVIGVPLVGPLALLVFIGAFIPIIGAPIAMIIAALVALAAKGPLAALLVIGLIFIVGELEGHVFQPLILGRAVALHPMAIVLLVAIGTAILGFLGALIAVPVGLVVYMVTKYLTDRLPDYPRAPLGAIDANYEAEMHRQRVIERAKAEKRSDRRWGRKKSPPAQ